jgi:putative aldouronate transport system substrate-binding protein
MKFKTLKVVTSIVIASSLMLTAACTNGSTTESNAANSSKTNAGESNSTKPVENEGSKPKDTNPFGKYDPAITVSSVKPLDGEMKLDINDNSWSNIIRDELGVKMNYLWTAPNDQALQKRSVMIASGKLPDFFQVTPKEFEDLDNAGKLADLTEAFDQYASPLLKELMTRDGGKALNSAKKAGKLMAFPYFFDSINDVPMLWIRKDWLDNLGLPEPKSMDDLYKIIEAFTTKDPDKNGKDDTYGIGVWKDLYGSVSNLNTFMNMYHAYPQTWVKDASGKLVFGSVQPEMKTVLAKLQEMYKVGQINKEFGMKDNNKIVEDIVAGKVGVEFGYWWNSYWPLQSSIDKDPKADWRCYPIFSADSKPAKVTVPLLNINDYTVVNKEFAHPEAVIKIANLYVEKMYGKTADFFKYNMDKDNNAVWKMSPLYVEPAQKVLYIHKALTDAVKTNDTSKLNPEEKSNYDLLLEYTKNGNRKNWSTFKSYLGEDSSMGIADYYQKNDLYAYNLFTGIPTKTIVERKASLDAMEKDVITRIIMGGSLDLYDKFVKDWNKAGGADMTNEVNDWYAAQSK